MAEERDPIGQENLTLYRQTPLRIQRLKTYEDMQREVIGKFNPIFYVIDNDSVSGLQDVLYLWTGIETRIVPASDVISVLEGLVDEAEGYRDEALSTVPIECDTIDTLIFPVRKGFIIANSDTNFTETPAKQLYYNDGTAAVKGDLYAMPFSQLKTLI